MFWKGNYLMKVVYYKGRKQWLIKNKKKGKDYHTHVAYENENAARMICIRAYKGTIPKDYPRWMVLSINRLWFGKDFEKRKDICNDNLYTNDPNVRIKKKKEKTNCIEIKIENNI